jgi:hypothetical protein
VKYGNSAGRLVAGLVAGVGKERSVIKPVSI